MARTRSSARAAAAALFALGLVACSYSVKLSAVFVNGHIGFIPADAGGRSPGPCLSHLTLSNEAGETVWELHRPGYTPSACDPWLPLIYGTAPPGLRVLVAPQRRLQMDIVYVLRGYAFNGIEGAFILHRDGPRITVENIDRYSPRANAAAMAADNRQAEQYQREFDNAHQLTDHNFEGPFKDRPLPPEQH